MQNLTKNKLNFFHNPPIIVKIYKILRYANKIVKK